MNCYLGFSAVTSGSFASRFSSQPEFQQPAYWNKNRIAVCYFNNLKNDLKSMFPNLSEQDANDLTWAGLYETIAFNNLPLAENERIMQTVKDFKDVTSPTGKGTPC